MSSIEEDIELGVAEHFNDMKKAIEYTCLGIMYEMADEKCIWSQNGAESPIAAFDRVRENDE